MAKNYTTQTASLKATTVDSRKVSSKFVDAEQIKVNGQDVSEVWEITKPEDYKKLITRCELPDDEDWAIYNDNGQLIYMNFADKIVNAVMSYNFDNLKTGNYMFYASNYMIEMNTNMSKLTSAVYMFQSCNNLQTFKGDLSSLTNGRCMFKDCKNLKNFTNTGNFDKLTDGRYMFQSCKGFEEFNYDLPSITNCTYMFYSSGLKSISSNINSSVTDGSQMFYNCEQLTNIDIDLSHFTTGDWMFSDCKSLQTFSKNLTSLKSATSMFADCTSLTSFESDLTNLEDGTQMFWGATNLSHFRGNLGKLKNGLRMFAECCLDGDSVEQILTTIPTVTNNPDLWLYVQESGVQRINSITGVTSTLSINQWRIQTYKGWKLTVLRTK